MKKNAPVLQNALPDMDIEITTDSNGNQFGWLQVTSAEELLGVAKQLAQKAARLCVITAFNQKKFDENSDIELVYTFDIDGTVLTISIVITANERTIPSLIDFFGNADWHEREFVELFDIKLTGRDKPKRLFLDPSIDTGVFNRLIPLSSMMNGASTKQLWETVFAETSMPDWAKEAK